MVDTFKNFYDEIPHKDMRALYKDYDKIKIEIPFRMIVCGNSGSGKSNWTQNFLHKLNCFTKIYLFSKCLDEPLYVMLKKKMERLMKKRKDPSLYFESNTLDDFPSFDTTGDEKNKFDKNEQSLVLIDDLMLEKNQINCRNAFIFGRKSNVSVIYICQNYFKLDPTIRKNSSILVLKKISTKRDLDNILNEVIGNVPFSIEQLRQIYRKSQEDFKTALLFDLNNSDPEMRTRINFKPIKNREEQDDDKEEI
jgi:hypothetical protein